MFNSVRSFKKRIKSILEDFFGKALPTTEGAWKEFFDKEKRELKDIKDLLYGDFNPLVRARALTILLVPDIDHIPFYHNNLVGFNIGRSGADIDLENLPPKIQEYMGEALIECFDYTKNKYRADVQTELYDRYNRYIIDLLTVLSEHGGTSERLFKRFELNDPVPYSNMDWASGYNPFKNILYKEGVPKRWKMAADHAMRRIIEEGKKPRVEWEDPLVRYIDHISFGWFDPKNPRYDLSLALSQARFIMDKPTMDSEYNRTRFLENVLSATPADKHPNIHSKICWYLTAGGPEEVTKKLSEKTAKEIVEHHKDGGIIYEKAQKILHKKRKQREKRKKQKEEEKQREEAVLAGLR